ncbi:MAG: RNA-binding protein [Epsilonproteobacteria bacterium]|nr:RNA-binding protein [Campylobacterota bacterium]
MKQIYVGNLPYKSTEEEVKKLFSQYGEVSSVKLITDRETGRARGFGFVEMDEESAKAAIQALDGEEFEGRRLKVNEARPKKFH